MPLPLDVSDIKQIRPLGEHNATPATPYITNIASGDLAEQYLRQGPKQLCNPYAC